jgi:HSP20 family molecular chaperone IbpA
LPVEVDADQVKAAYQHGLLIVTLAKAAAAKPKQITVTVT